MGGSSDADGETLGPDGIERRGLERAMPGNRRGMRSCSNKAAEFTVRYLFRRPNANTGNHSLLSGYDRRLIPLWHRSYPFHREVLQRDQ